MCSSLVKQTTWGLLFTYPSVVRWESLKMPPALLVGILMTVRLNVTVHSNEPLLSLVELPRQETKEKEKGVSMVSGKGNMLCEVGESSGASLVM